MIINKTHCEECIHSKVCKNRDNTKMICEKLINSTCQPEPNVIYKWGDMCNRYNVKIELSCPDFEKRQTTLLRGKM